MAIPLFEETNKESLDFYAKIIDTLPIPIFWRKKDGCIELCNNAFALTIGKSVKEIVGKKTIEIMPFNHDDVLSIKDAEILQNGNDVFYETKIRHADGEMREVIVNKSAMKIEGNEISGTLGSIIDISERKKIQHQLSKAEEDKMIAETMLQKIRAGIVIVNQDLKIIDSNLGFARLVDTENEELFETIPGLKGADLDMLAPKIIIEMFRSILESGESWLERDFKFQNKLLSAGVMTIQKNKIAGAIIRDLSAPMLERAEIIERAKQVNRKNMKTVQQIAYLLGENAAQTEELLNSIIESQKYDVEE